MHGDLGGGEGGGGEGGGEGADGGEGGGGEGGGGEGGGEGGGGEGGGGEGGGEGEGGSEGGSEGGERLRTQTLVEAPATEIRYPATDVASVHWTCSDWSGSGENLSNAVHPAHVPSRQYSYACCKVASKVKTIPNSSSSLLSFVPDSCVNSRLAGGATGGGVKGGDDGPQVDTM